jgi:hypothetical protein
MKSLQPPPDDPCSQQDLSPEARGDGSVVAATEKSLAAARHLTDADAGAVEVLRQLAREIDVRDYLRELALDYAAEHKSKPPGIDNVTVPTYLKFCDSLGLTPAGRERLKPTEGGAGGNLSRLRSVRSPA